MLSKNERRATSKIKVTLPHLVVSASGASSAQSCSYWHRCALALLVQHHRRDEVGCLAPIWGGIRPGCLAAAEHRHRDWLACPTPCPRDPVCLPLRSTSCVLIIISEAAYDEAPSSYFPLLQLLTTHLPTGNKHTDQQILSTALGLIESHSLLPGPSAISSLQLALALHTTAPRIVAAERWYDGNVDEDKLGTQGCGSWVEWRGKGFCDVEDLRRDMELSIGGGKRNV